MQNFIKKTFPILVFIVLFGTVAPAVVFGDSTIYLSNTVTSSSNTGGQHGSRGTAGVDGTDGADGQDGGQGSSVRTGEATIKVENIVDGEVVTNVYANTDGEGVVLQQTDVAEMTDQSVASVTTATATADTETYISAETTTTPVSETRFHFIITTLQTIIDRYVNLLF